MSSRKSILITALCFLFITNTSSAVMCARLKSVSGGEDHTLALADNGTLWACGGKSGNYKQLGLGSGVVYPVLSLHRVHGPNDVGFLSDIINFDAGLYHSLAVEANHFVWAWGTDGYGKLGNGPDEGDSPVPIRVHGVNDVNFLEDIVAVSAGRSGEHSLAVDSNGYVYAWGWNSSGQCGNGEIGNYKLFPVLVLDSNSQTQGRYLGDEAHIIAVDAGVYHSIALDDEGHVWQWGSGSSTVTYPEKVKKSDSFGGTELSNIVQISSCTHSVAVDSNGNVWEWYYSRAYKVP
ncbi:MAG: hypothetical protein MUP16_05585, partial [Sedimentisphaerales bacterium]|nr:hypothetical protein [Sedimentisphaerales bacterium]